MYRMGVSKNRGTPKASILIGFSIINHPFWGFSPYFWKHPYSFGPVQTLVNPVDTEKVDENPWGENSDDCHFPTVNQGLISGPQHVAS